MSGRSPPRTGRGTGGRKASGYSRAGERASSGVTMVPQISNTRVSNTINRNHFGGTAAGPPSTQSIPPAANQSPFGGSAQPPGPIGAEPAKNIVLSKQWSDEDLS